MIAQIEKQVQELQVILNLVCKRATELQDLREKLKSHKPEDLVPVTGSEVSIMIPVNTLFESKINEIIHQQNKASDHITDLFKTLDDLIHPPLPAPPVAFGLPSTFELEEAIRQAALDRVAERSVEDRDAIE